MSQSVTIKSNKYGINLVLDADMSFADLIKAVVEKFKASWIATPVTITPE